VNTQSWHQTRLLGEADPQIDPALAEILEAYLTALEQGAAPHREEFLSQHPQHAHELAPYLPWVELLYQAKPREAAGDVSSMPRKLGDFRVLGEIGRGGMGIVYEAEQVSLERRVALKVLPYASTLDERQLSRFKNEALAAAQLQHPNIVPVFAVGCEHGLHFYVMQLIEGRTVEKVIDDAKAETADASIDNSTIRVASEQTNANAAASLARFRAYAQWIVQAADALDYAHEQGVVHRDIKPSNLMISSAGELWVTDFGLARTQHDASMTVTGELLGTLRYMSPEQLKSKPGFVDHRTDIYSLGLTLYELIAGRPAFEGPSQQDLIHQIGGEEPPSLLKLHPRVPRDLDSIVRKAISKTPDARYASARDMADDLRAFLDGRPTQAQPATWRDHCEKWVRRHARLVASAGVALAVVLVCAVASAVLVWQARNETQQALVLANANHLRAERHLQDARSAVDDLFTGVATDLAEVPGAEPVRRQLLTDALEYYRRFAKQAAADPAVRDETAAAYYRCGQINEQLGDDDAARAAYGEARNLWQKLYAEDAGDAALRSLALCENNLGLIDLRSGRTTSAIALLRKALRLQEQLAARKPKDGESQRSLALGSANLGMALGQAGQIRQGRESLQRALELQQAAGATSSAARGDLATTYNQLAYLTSSHSPADAEAAYRRAADEFERLAKDEPRVLWWQAQLASTLNNLAALAAQAQRFDEAEADYRRAIEIQRQLAERAPQVVAYARDLAVSQNNLGYLLSRQKKDSLAIVDFEEAKANLSHLAGAHDRSPELASRLGAVCNNLGLAYENQQAGERAQAAYSDAIDWQQKALALSPGWSQAESYLETHQANLLRVLQASGAHDAADKLKAAMKPNSGRNQSARPIVQKAGDAAGGVRQGPPAIQPAGAVLPRPVE
jgi:serine/threonine protein kinase/tetratricopeptide (TPR) repeat protein